MQFFHLLDQLQMTAIIFQIFHHFEQSPGTDFPFFTGVNEVRDRRTELIIEMFGTCTFQLFR